MSRPKGNKNKNTIGLPIAYLEAYLGINPVEILLRFAAGDWKGLGYGEKSTTKWTPSGIEYEEDVITPQMRIMAASQAASFFHPKKKSVEVTIDDKVEDRQNKLDQLHAEFRAMREDQPKDILCHGQTLTSPSPAQPLVLESSMVSLKPKAQE